MEPIGQAIRAGIAQIPAPCRPVAEHILDAGGKRIRPFLAVMCGRALGDQSSDLYILAASLEMLHAATLLHDDVLDNATSRRGRTAAHTVYGISQTILAGDAMLAAGNAMVAAFGNPALVACYSRATVQTAAGEILEMSSLGRPELTHGEYLEIARGKTACLISEACAMGAIAAGATREQIEACLDYGENLGIAFQLVDDALDFAPQSQTGKPSGGDLREGKMTPPLRFYRQSLSPQKQAAFDKSFIARSFSDEEAGAIAAEVCQFASHARDLADSCLGNALDSLLVLPQCEETLILREMTTYVRSRLS